MSFSEFVHEQYRDLPIIPESCENQIIIVTGANSGLGFEAAKHFVYLNASRVILAVRSKAKGEAAKALIESATDRRGVAEVWELDMASYTSIKSFAQRASADLNRIDIVLENAAIALDTWTEAEGLETSLTVNVVGTMLLAMLLLPKLKDTAKKYAIQPHLTVVTSGLGFQARFLENIKGDFLDALNKKENKLHQRYSVTKLLQIYAVRELATQLPQTKTGVVINLLSPGLCTTNLTQYASLKTRIQVGLLRLLFARTAEMGSRTLLHAAVAGPESHAQYLSDCAIKDHLVPSWVKSNGGKNVQAKVFREVTARLEIIEPDCVASALSQ